ncbi:MAG: helix-turn-helix transcriptional regulator [Ruminococcus sp.]|nr:helix-turn-helix transcriptional regulator [Ruminococcus sp.]
MTEYEKGLTQTELAEAVGVTLRTVQNYEGKNLFPKIRTL